MTRQVARLQEQVETANGTVAELSEDLEKANSRADKTHKDSLLAMEQVYIELTELVGLVEIRVSLITAPVRLASAPASFICILQNIHSLSRQTLLNYFHNITWK